MANENVLTDEQKPFVPADTVDSKGTVWPTVGENIRKGVNGELADVYGRMPDLDAVGEFWSKLTGYKCIAEEITLRIDNSGKITVPDPYAYIDIDGIPAIYVLDKRIFFCYSNLRYNGLNGFYLGSRKSGLIFLPITDINTSFAYIVIREK